MVSKLVGGTHDGQEHHCSTLVAGTREYAAPAWSVVPACQGAVGLLGGDAEVGYVLVQRADAGLLRVGEDERAGWGAEAVACDEEVEVSSRRGIGEGDLDFVVGGIVDRFDIIVKDVPHFLLGSIIQDLCKGTPQNLRIRCETLSLPTAIDSELRSYAIIAIDKCEPFFVRGVFADGISKSHATYDFKASAADVYILPHCPQCGGALNDCYVSAGTGKPEGESWTGDASACY